MGIRKTFISFDKFLEDTKDVIHVHRYSKEYDNDIGYLKKALMVTYEDEVISIIPRCHCGKLHKMYHEGTFCEDCKTTVKPVFKTYRPDVWMVVLDGIDHWINPDFVGMIEKILNLNVRVLRWIGDSKYNPPLGKSIGLLTSMREIEGFERSYNWLCNNLGKIIVFLMNSTAVKKEKVESLSIAYDLFNENPECIFSKNLPLLNKQLNVIVKNSMGTYGNNGVGSNWDMALHYLKGIESTSQKFKSSITMKIIDSASILSSLMAGKFLGGPGGVFRKHLHGARFPFSGRAVIIPICVPHDGNTVMLPWGMSLVIYRLHIIKYLVKNGHSLYTASNLHLASINQFNQEISDILDQMLLDSPYKGVAVGIQRNPSLRLGSHVSLFAGFKKDPTDTTISISVLLAKLIAGDFDGDEGNVMAYLDTVITELFKTFAPENSVLDASVPCKVSGRITLSDTGVALVSEAIGQQMKVTGVEIVS